ncbi:MAG TPA: hypothetical protein VH307_31650 [Streptosporangiaceae bacterium]|nr:hypothetical protein [Streptosporangiaceae bacterium]
MLQVRFNLITADPLRLGDSLKFIEAEVRPVVESLRGSLGISLYANPELGVAIVESFWASRVALVQSEEMVSPGRQEAVRRAGGTVAVERYRVPVFEREAPLSPGAALRLTRMDIQPSGVADAVEAYGDTAVPGLAETEGFRGALLLADRDTGHLISETIWRNPQALAASRSVAAAVWVDTVASTGCVIRAVEEYGVIFSSARKA